MIIIDMRQLRLVALTHALLLFLFLLAALLVALLALARLLRGLFRGGGGLGLGNAHAFRLGRRPEARWSDCREK